MAEQLLRPNARGPSGVRGANWQDPSAPVDAAGLTDALRPFGASRMLPRSAYTDPAVFTREQAHFFDGGRCCAGFTPSWPGREISEPSRPDPATVLTYSESANPASPHYADQTKLFSDRGWVTPHFCPDQVAAHAVSTGTVRSR